MELYSDPKVYELYEILFRFVFFVLRIYLFTIVAVESSTYVFKITRKKQSKKRWTTKTTSLHGNHIPKSSFVINKKPGMWFELLTVFYEIEVLKNPDFWDFFISLIPLLPFLEVLRGCGSTLINVAKVNHLLLLSAANLAEEQNPSATLAINNGTSNKY